MAKPKKTKAVAEADAVDTNPLPTNDLIAKIAYDRMRERIEGNFPNWSDLKPATQADYQEAADYAQHNEPRTTYEKIVKEVMDNG